MFIEFLEIEFKKQNWVLEQEYIDLFYSDKKRKQSKLQKEKVKLKKQSKKIVSKKQKPLDLRNFGHLTLIDAYHYKKQNG